MNLYVLSFPNGKAYVGITTKSVETRFSWHQSSARNGSLLLVHKAIRKHGIPTITHIAEGKKEEIAQMEIDLIEEFGTLAPNGYNLDKGGSCRNPSVAERRARSIRARQQDISHLQDPEVRARQGKSMREVWNRPGYRKTVSAKISETRKGIPLSGDHRRALSEAAKKRVISDEGRRKLSEAQSRRWARVRENG